MASIKPSQIVYLEHCDARLYTEAIQLAGRHRLWARPLMLVQGLPENPYFRQQAIATAAADLENCALELHDLKSAPDLVWPAQSFQIAFDMDFFSLLFHLRVSESQEQANIANLQFNQFLKASWHSQDTDSTFSSKTLIER